MKVNLIQNTIEPLEIMWTSARTCYSELESNDLYIDGFYKGMKNKDFKQKQQNLVIKVLDSGHHSIARHVYFSFCLDGISRACINQLQRHAIGFAYSQQSLRYVEIKEDFKPCIDLTAEQIDNIVKKYYVNPYCNKDQKLLYSQFNLEAYNSLCGYRLLIDMGSKPEDARGILGLNFKTNVVCSCNLEALIHLCNLRLCSRSQKEIRDMVSLMKNEVLKNDNYKFLSKYLTPKCKTCTEKDKCEK